MWLTIFTIWKYIVHIYLIRLTAWYILKQLISEIGNYFYLMCVWHFAKLNLLISVFFVLLFVITELDLVFPYVWIILRMLHIQCPGHIIVSQIRYLLSPGHIDMSYCSMGCNTMIGPAGKIGLALDVLISTKMLFMASVKLEWGLIDYLLYRFPVCRAYEDYNVEDSVI